MPVKTPSKDQQSKKQKKGRSLKRAKPAVWTPVLQLEPRGSNIRQRKYPVLPNPWPPANIERLIEIAVTWGGLAPVAYKLIALWIEDRKAQKIQIKHDQHELEIQGGVSGRKIEQAINQFRRLTKLTEEDKVKIALPPRVDHSIPLEMVQEAHRREENKKSSKKKSSKK